jgi:hypothetical protein
MTPELQDDLVASEVGSFDLVAAEILDVNHHYVVLVPRPPEQQIYYWC